MKFVIITPTTGNPKLEKLLISINNQTKNNNIEIEHLIVIDGPNFKEKVDLLLNKIEPINKRFVFNLPYNTGGNGYLGHRIYASISQIVNGDWVILLDEDNYYDNNHVLSFYEKIIDNNKLEWLFCLRKIINDDGYVCEDNCESLGYLSNVFYNKSDNLIDTNCYCIKKEVIIETSHLWNRIGTNDFTNPDRVFAKYIMSKYLNYVCTNQYTINYYVGNRENSVKADLFVNGNQIIMRKYGRIPWNDNKLFIIHFNKEQTENVISRVYGGNIRPFKTVAYDQWNLNLFDILSQKILLINGYTEYIPSGSKVLVILCHLQELPNYLITRNDIEKIVYTFESPNYRHKQQWDNKILNNIFNKIITYWTPQLTNNKFVYLPFIHRFDMCNPNDLDFITENKSNDKSICMVLENRNLSDEYIINGINLKSQDNLRWEYAKNLGKRIYCYGNSWEKNADIINYKKTQNRMLNQEKVIDLMKGHTFCLIIENCNAENYVSEKLYDALTVGCIPLYYGNNSKLINIPESCYIDLKKILPNELPILIDKMDNDIINMFRNNIYNKRMKILENVSINKFSEKILLI